MVVAAAAAAAPAPRQGLGGLRRGGGAGVSGRGGRSPGPAMGRPELGALRPLALLLLLLLQLQHLSAADPLPGGQGAYGASRAGSQPPTNKARPAVGVAVRRGPDREAPGTLAPWICLGPPPRYPHGFGYRSSTPAPGTLLMGDGRRAPPPPARELCGG